MRSLTEAEFFSIRLIPYCVRISLSERTFRPFSMNLTFTPSTLKILFSTRPIVGIYPPAISLKFQCCMSWCNIAPRHSFFNFHCEHFTLHKRYYEQVDGKTTDITGEIPFDLPDGWAFCRMGSAVDFIGGSQPPKSVFSFSPAADTIRLIQIRDYKSDKFKTYIPRSMAKRFCSAEDIMIGRYGPPIFQILRGIEGAYNVALMKAEPCNAISKNYLYYLLKDHALLTMIESLSDRTCGQDGVSMYDLRRYIIALPPLAEQQRIVAQIESLLKCVDEIDRESETLEKSVALAKQKILDLAIRGKLVRQDPNDEPASELLKKIKAEKEALIKAGKLKRDKHESFIFRGDDNRYYEQLDEKTVEVTPELPFKIPESWCWCRLGSLCDYGSCQSADPAV
ncbi:MAG: restriction endonuclease subunit S, partial [Alphaproteobacteria bacterium]|nr:restriction endonuclease subunit S [Alphaproteobacteria bacterium]